MKAPVCRLCHEAHWGNCAGVEPSRGSPRVEARAVAAPPSIPRIKPTLRVQQRKPILGDQPWAPSPQPSSSSPSAASQSAPPSSSPPSSSPANVERPDPDCPRCALLRLRITQLEALLTKAEAGVTVTKKRGNAVTVTKRTSGNAGNALTPAEKQKAYRARKAARKPKNPG
jgi:hypothetical protein